jgi:hypothetical protein
MVNVEPEANSSLSKVTGHTTQVATLEVGFIK